MSQMIELSGGVYVAADCIAEVKVNSSSQTITVRTKNGTGHCHHPDDRNGLYHSADKLIAKINQALAGKGGEA